MTLSQLVLAGAVVSLVLGDPPVLRPGSPELVTAGLGARRDSTRVWRLAGADDTVGTPLGAGSYHAEIPITVHGRPGLLLISSSSGRGHTFVDSAAVLRDGLVPVWEVMHADARVRRYEYEGKHVRVTLLAPDSAPVTRDHAYPVPVFHFNELGPLLRSLPLRDGYRAILPLYSEGDDSLEMDTASVTGPTAEGRWMVRFADPVITLTQVLDGTSRTELSAVSTRRVTGDRFRSARVPVTGTGE